MVEKVTDYMFQIFMRKGTSEHALMVLFDISL
jgi:hypothetical protein